MGQNDIWGCAMLRQNARYERLGAVEVEGHIAATSARTAINEHRGRISARALHQSAGSGSNAQTVDGSVRLRPASQRWHYLRP